MRTEYAAATSPTSSAAVRKRRLTTLIGLFYTLLAAINIVFFSVMIFENQSDLLQSDFLRQAEGVARTIEAESARLRLQRDEDQGYKRLELALAPYDLKYYIVFDESRQIWRTKAGPGFEAPSTIEAELEKRIQELLSQELVFRSRRPVWLNEADYSLELLLPMQGASGERLFLSAAISVRSMHEKLRSLYLQIALAIVWGLVFHALFGLLVYKLIFTRLNALKQAAEAMEDGDLAARAVWDAGRNDELDEVGRSFNRMAVSIQEKVTTIQNQMREIERLDAVIENEMLTGKEVQECFLTTLDNFPEYKPAIFYLPLRQVSGDLYSLHRLPDGRAAAFVTDAAGHGVSASLITAMMALLAETAFENDPQPERTLTFLNLELGRRLPPYFYASGIVAVLHKDYISFSNAGHTPGVVYRAKGDRHWLMEASSTPLGMNPEAIYERSEISVAPGDRILFYTDGLSESENEAGEPFGLERILAVLRENAKTSTAQCLAALETAWRAHHKGVVDDTTILLLEVPQ